MTLRDTLSRAAQRITDGALAELTDEAQWRRLLPERRRRFLEMMGLETLAPREARPPVPVTCTGVVQRPGYRIEKLSYESLPQLYVTANLYVPDAPAHTRLPAVLYVCGHSATQKVEFQAHARRFAELGFVCLIVETIQLGEVRGHHHGCYSEGWHHWYSRGYTPAGVELLNGIRGLDLLTERPEVDPDRLGVTGISGGGAVTWYVAAADERIRVAAPVCGTATLASHITERTIDGHCDCMWWINTYQWDLADVGSLIAPRPLMIASADRDEIFTIASIRKVHAQLQGLYERLDAPENLHLIETPGGHSYHERSRTGIFSLFARHLQHREIAPEAIGDVDERPERQESEETLRVFVNGPLPEDRTTTIQETFLPVAEPPTITNLSDLERARLGVVEALRARTFRAFPTAPPPLEVQAEFEFLTDDSRAGCRFAYTSEEGRRLHGRFHLPTSAARPAPVVLALRSPDEERGRTERALRHLDLRYGQAFVDLCGVGDSSWGPGLQWHLRRAAAWTGRTLASLRVWDALRAIQAVRSLPEVEEARVSLSARGEMAAVALYAALLDGRIEALYLEAPPATQNAPSRPDGSGEALEMLNCLRITDLPQVAGLLCPTRLVLVGDCPDTYQWAEALYARMGASKQFRCVAELRHAIENP